MSPTTMPRRSRAAILWGLLFVVCGQIALAVAIERWRLECADPEYGYQLKRLCSRLAEHPGKPLVLVLGSSRTANGFETDRMPPPGEREGEAPMVFNLSRAGSGPVMNLLVLQRLLALGIHPRGVVVEVLPPMLGAEEPRIKAGEYPAQHCLRWNDLEVIRQLVPDGANLRYLQWLQCNGVPWYTHRLCLMVRYAPSWLLTEEAGSVTCFVHDWSPWGWLRHRPEKVTPQQFHKGLAFTRQEYLDAVDFSKVGQASDRALREFLEQCRRDQISVIGLVLMPETSAFRSWYKPATRSLFKSYLTDLAREYGTQFIDADCWLGDECFADGHHLLPDGARAFTERFWREVMEPWFKGNSAPTCSEPHLARRDG